jgi:hypothetical protein
MRFITVPVDFGPKELEVNTDLIFAIGEMNGESLIYTSPECFIRTSIGKSELMDILKQS